LQGIAAARRYRFAPAVQAYERGGTLYRTVESPQGEASALINNAVLRYRMGDFTGALATIQPAFALFQQIGDQRGQCVAALNRSLLQTTLGDGAAGERDAQAALGLADALAIPFFRSRAYSALGGALLRLGRPGAAADAYRESAAHDGRSHESYPTDLSWRAVAHLQLGDLVTADALTAEALMALDAHPHLDLPQLIPAVRALVLQQRGDCVGAAALIAKAAQLLEQICAGIPAPVDRQRYLRGIAANRFIRAASRGGWTTQHPLF
jgi:tetratricopeptide (TPR) repeat protein